MVSTPSTWTRIPCARCTEISASCATFPRSSPTRPAWDRPRSTGTRSTVRILSATSISEIKPENYQDVTVDFEPFGLGASSIQPRRRHQAPLRPAGDPRGSLHTRTGLGPLEFIAGSFLQHEALRGRQYLSVLHHHRTAAVSEPARHRQQVRHLERSGGIPQRLPITYCRNST